MPVSEGVWVSHGLLPPRGNPLSFTAKCHGGASPWHWHFRAKGPAQLSCLPNLTSCRCGAGLFHVCASCQPRHGVSFVSLVTRLQPNFRWVPGLAVLGFTCKSDVCTEEGSTVCIYSAILDPPRLKIDFDSSLSFFFDPLVDK